MDRRHLAILVSASCLPVNCVVEVDTTAVGKPCPCPAELRCDEVTDTCVASATCHPRITLDDDGLRWEWRTPHTIRWQWRPIGKPSDFDHYRMIVGSSRADVENDAAGVEFFDASRNPELAFLTPPESTTGLASTVTDGLTPFNPLQAGVGRNFAKLEIVDRDGCTFVSDVLEVSTQEQTTCGEVVFDDQLPMGAQPTSLEVSSNCGAAESEAPPCLACTAESECSTSDGWSILLPFEPVSETLTEGNVDQGRAFLQLSLALTSDEGGFITVGITVVDANDPCDAEPSWTYSELFPRTGQSIDAQRLELPLNQLRNATGERFSRAAMESRRICALQISAGPGVAGDVFFDDIAGCW